MWSRRLNFYLWSSWLLERIMSEGERVLAEGLQEWLAGQLGQRGLPGVLMLWDQDQKLGTLQLVVVRLNHRECEWDNQYELCDPNLQQRLLDQVRWTFTGKRV